MSVFKTYILENPEGRLYIGYSENIDVRLAWHNDGKSKFTSKKGPWRIVFMKDFESKTEAIKYEKYLKSLKSKKYIKKVIIGE